jgi:hypothetical protein
MDDQNPKQSDKDQEGNSLPLPGNGSPSQPVPEVGFGDGRIPPELREWVFAQATDEELLRSMEEVNPQDCLELSEFLDLDELDRAVASELAQRKSQ